MHVQAILFDIGGVVVKDLGLRESARKTLGIADADTFWNSFNEAVLPACRGEEELADAWLRMGRELDIPVSEQISKYLWQGDYEANIEIDRELLDFVRSLRSSVKTGVISNTVEEHAAILRKLGVYEPFDEVVLSHEVGITKDSPEIFELALDRLELPASSVVFIDDVERYRKVAEDVGMTAFLYRDLPDLCEKMELLGF